MRWVGMTEGMMEKIFVELVTTRKQKINLYISGKRYRAHYGSLRFRIWGLGERIAVGTAKVIMRK
jgi:hypothetical protein